MGLSPWEVRQSFLRRSLLSLRWRTHVKSGGPPGSGDFSWRDVILSVAKDLPGCWRTGNPSLRSGRQDGGPVSFLACRTGPPRCRGLCQGNGDHLRDGLRSTGREMCRWLCPLGSRVRTRRFALHRGRHGFMVADCSELPDGPAGLMDPAPPEGCTTRKKSAER